MYHDINQIEQYKKKLLDGNSIGPIPVFSLWWNSIWKPWLDNLFILLILPVSLFQCYLDNAADGSLSVYLFLFPLYRIVHVSDCDDISTTMFLHFNTL